MVLQAAGQLDKPPKRIVLVAGMVPLYQRSMLSVLPQKTRVTFRILSVLSAFSGKGLRLPRSVIYNFLCNGMDPMEVVHSVGRFGPVARRVLTTKVALDRPEPTSPVTYVVLNQDKILPPESQHRMAQRVPGVDVVELDSCHQVMLQQPRELAEILLEYA